eukprot:507090-Pyramimonas_sp.AAC.1
MGWKGEGVIRCILSRQRFGFRCQAKCYPRFILLHAGNIVPDIFNSGCWWAEGEEEDECSSAAAPETNCD